MNELRIEPDASLSAGPEIRLLLIGRGYVARRLAGRIQRMAAGGGRAAAGPRMAVLGATHRPDGAPRQPDDIRFGDSAAVEPLLAGATHLLVSVPPDAGGDDAGAIRHCAGWAPIGWRRSRRCAGSAISPRPASTATMAAPGWMRMRRCTPPERPASRPASRMGRRRAGYRPSGSGSTRAGPDASRRGLPVTLFRLSGIYGPGRSSFDALDAGTARRIDKPGHVFCRCHVDDICSVLLRSMSRAGTGAGTAPVYPVYNVADDLPAPQRAVVEFAAGLAGVAPPPLAPYDKAALPPALQRFYEACRRIRNDRIKDDLGVALQFPTYREGLHAIAMEEGRL